MGYKSFNICDGCKETFSDYPAVVDGATLCPKCFNKYKANQAKDNINMAIDMLRQGNQRA